MSDAAGPRMQIGLGAESREDGWHAAVRIIVTGGEHDGLDETWVSEVAHAGRLEALQHTQAEADADTRLRREFLQPLDVLVKSILGPLR